MTPGQVRNTCQHYRDMFGSGMSCDAMDLLRNVWNVEQLDEIEDQLSAGEYDCAEAILENR